MSISISKFLPFSHSKQLQSPEPQVDSVGAKRLHDEEGNHSQADTETLVTDLGVIHTHHPQQNHRSVAWTLLGRLNEPRLHWPEETEQLADVTGIADGCED